MSKGLASYYLGMDPIRAYIQEMEVRMGEITSSPLGAARRDEYLEEYQGLLTKGEHILSWYTQWAKGNDDFEVTEVETPRSFILGEVELGLVPDAVINRQGVSLCLEHKLRSRYSPRPWALDLQSRLYCLATGSEGTLYNFILYKKMDIVRTTILRSREELEITKDLLKILAQRIIEAEEDPDYIWIPNPSPLCNCEYIELCIAESQGLDSSYLKENLFVRREDGDKEEDPRDED